MIYNFLSEYLSIIIFLFIALFLSIGFIIANYLASPSNPDPEKLSAYECGFEPFDDSRMEFDVRFYLMGRLAQLVEHLVYTERVIGSSPLPPTII